MLTYRAPVVSIPKFLVVTGTLSIFSRKTTHHNGVRVSLVQAVVPVSAMVVLNNIPHDCQQARLHFPDHFSPVEEVADTSLCKLRKVLSDW